IGNAVRRRAVSGTAPKGLGFSALGGASAAGSSTAPKGLGFSALGGASAAGSGTVRLEPEDFEVAETERRASAVVALCVDLSYSMFADGRWGPMKQTALALSHLVATQFPQDSLQIIGFGRYAMSLSQGELAAIEPDMVQGTNLQHALKLAGRHLRRHPGSEPVVLVVTDGEPTAHLDDDGDAFFMWPTLPETVQATVREVDQLTRYGATLNLFMLGEDEGLRRFVDAVAQRSGGRVFSPDLGELGRYVVDDYVRSRRGRR
ncbi:VWA domain-containing protein, partial [Actinoplanes sp. NPDC051633]|uniref:VWA domain-containing protein n=1 Tax=Actinoplanes sp. NPDC051633 TaxID=3155670 RepID=UPI003427FEDE